MNQDVNKWKKKEILIQYGLSSLKEIEGETKRYKKEELNILYRNILNTLKKDEQNYYFIIKLVPQELRPKLKNYLIYDQDDLRQFIISKKDYYNYKEIWCCKGHQNIAESVYGRFFLNFYGFDICQFLELSLGGTARALDQISLNRNLPYLCAKRLSWGRQYYIEYLEASSDDLKSLLLASYQRAALELEHLRDNFLSFLQDLSLLDICGISFDFLLYPNKMVIIDWDTVNDNVILQNLHQGQGKDGLVL